MQKYGYNGSDIAVQVVEALKETGADGIDGDTMASVPEEWWNASVDAGFPIALQPEGGGTLRSMNWQTMSTLHCEACNKPGSGTSDSPYFQAVDRYKWLEPRHMTNVRNRWQYDKTDTLHFVYFNGVGYEATENEWGSWIGLRYVYVRLVRLVQYAC